MMRIVIKKSVYYEILSMRKAYNPNQPRAENGRWSKVNFAPDTGISGFGASEGFGKKLDNKCKFDEHNFKKRNISIDFGTVYEQSKPDALEAAYFLKSKQDGIVTNSFVGVNKNSKKKFVVGLCWGGDEEKIGLCKIIEKHIIKQSDFENISEAIRTVQNALEIWKRKRISDKNSI